jgi:hypothetical protein
LVGSVVVSVQTPPQSVWSAGQLHMPATHVLPPLHGVPQAPQLLSSVRVFVQTPRHDVSLGGHVATQAPVMQKGVAIGQMLPQPALPVPQLFGSAAVSTQTPLQSVSPAGHAHWPFLHCCVWAQVIPQPPQFFGSFFSRTHDPPQFVLPVGQPWSVQTPLEQTWSAGQTLPQVPQL